MQVKNNTSSCMLALMLALSALSCGSEVDEYGVAAPNGQSTATLVTKDTVLSAEGGILYIKSIEGSHRIVLYDDDSGSRVKFAHFVWSNDSDIIVGAVSVTGRPLIVCAFSKQGVNVPLNEQLRALVETSIAAKYSLGKRALDPLTWASTAEAAQKYKDFKSQR